MSTTADITAALFAYLADEQLASPALRIAYPGVKFTPEGQETYLRATILPNETRSQMVGGGQDQHLGILQVLVCFPHGDAGIVDPLERAGEVVRQFAKGTNVITTGGLKIKISRTPWISPLLTEPARLMIPVSVPYTVAVGS
jgi:hypothetical protein